MSSINKMVGGVLVALLAVGGLTACGQADASSDVSCDDVTFSVAETQADIKNAEEKVEESAGTPGEKSSKAELKTLREQLKKLNACKDEKATKAETPNGLDENKLAKAFAKEFKSLGFKPGDVKVGEVDWDENPVDHRRGAFTSQIRSQAELTSFLNSDTDEGRAAKQHVLKAVPKSERERVLNGKNYIPVQYNVAVQYAGNSIWQGDKLSRGGTLAAQKGDIAWVFVGTDSKIYWDASIRADCGNAGYTKPPTPYCEEDECPPPPGDECPPSAPHGPYPLCKDGPGAQRTTGDGPGRNYDPGSGEYISPGDMDRPSDTPRTNPPPASGGGSGGTPDPTPPPSPEPSAPPPSDPETGCIVIPGVEDCK